MWKEVTKSQSIVEKLLPELKQEGRNRISFEEELSDQDLKLLLEKILEERDKTEYLPFSARSKLSQELFYSFRKLGVLQELLEDASVTEIMVNGYQRIFYEKEGRLYEWPYHFKDREELSDLIQKICGYGNRAVNEASPIVDTRLPDGSRVNIILYPVAADDSVIDIRKFPEHPMKMKDLIQLGSLSREVAVFLEKLVISKYNIFVSGGTGSGKTTFLNALSEFIPCEERVITIEDSVELQLNNLPNLIRLETRVPNFSTVRMISIRDLIKTSLRMRPDRIIVGECRGAEALDLLQALNTGHDGGMGTGHANSPKDMLSRLETMVLMGMDLPVPAIRGQIYSGIDILVHLGKLRDKSRRVLQISELEAYQNGEISLRTIYEFCEDQTEDGSVSGNWMKRAKLLHTQKLLRAGYGGAE